MWCPNPTNVNSLGSGFGLQIYLLVISSQFYRFSFKHSLNSPTTSILVISSPKTLSFSNLVPHLLLYISLFFFCPPSFVYTLLLPSYFLLFSSFFQHFTHQPPLIYPHPPYIIISSQWGSNHYYFETCSRRQIVFGKDFLKALLALESDLNFSTSLLIYYCLNGQQQVEV